MKKTTHEGACKQMGDSIDLSSTSLVIVSPHNLANALTEYFSNLKSSKQQDRCRSNQAAKQLYLRKKFLGQKVCGKILTVVTLSQETCSAKNYTRKGKSY